MNRAWALFFAFSLIAGCSAAGERRGGGGRTDGGVGTDGGAGCGAGLTECGAGECVDLSEDVAHCGACDRACATGEACVAGACTTECGGTRNTLCAGDGCVDILTDPRHCGGCGIRCLDGMHCSGGECMTSCGEFADLCMGECRDFRTDPDNCGSCGNACPVADHASATCSDSACGYECDTGWGDCNGLAEDGCEVELAVDLDHCGACDHACPTPEHATPTCESGTCGFVCDTGWADCNTLPEDGCEADLTSPDTCGSCDNACLAGEACVDGVCESGSCYDGPARILVYGPGGTLGTGMIPSGTATVTVATEAMWSTMTTADFGMYDVLWFDGNDCAGDAATVFGTAQDTIDEWGPAVRGRSLIMIGDPDHHGGAAAATFYTNAATWLRENGRNVDGGRTSLFFNWGCTVFNSNSSGMVPGRGTPEQFTAVLGTPIVTDVTNFCAATTAPAGVGHPVLAGISSYWSCPLHGGFSSYPTTDWTVITYGGTSGNGILVRDPMPCTP